MAKFATLPTLPETHVFYSSTDFSSKYKENAEYMMNHAAEAGDLKAIVSISFAYSSGYIASAMGELPVEADQIKAMAAASALSWIRDNVEKEKLPVWYLDGDDGPMKNWIRARLARANQDELNRFDRLESEYLGAYRGQAMDNQVAHNLLDDLPEQACASLSRAPAGARRGL
jgi:hypothetical protein